MMMMFEIELSSRNEEDTDRYILRRKLLLQVLLTATLTCSYPETFSHDVADWKCTGSSDLAIQYHRLYTFGSYARRLVVQVVEHISKRTAAAYGSVGLTIPYSISSNQIWWNYSAGCLTERRIIVQHRDADAPVSYSTVLRQIRTKPATLGQSDLRGTESLDVGHKTKRS